MLKEDYLYVASDYYRDAEDFLHRYRLTVDDFYATKSKRFKLFIDLRMAAECALKASIAYYNQSELCRKDLIQKTKCYGHKIKEMKDELKSNSNLILTKSIEKYFLDLDNLPVGVRYRLDGMDYREANEEIYYQTIGDDDWLDGLYENLKQFVSDIGKKLSSHSRVIPSSELFNEILKPSFNKYRDQKPSSKKSGA